MGRGGGRLYVGTSGYTYPHWRGRFYPAGVPARTWLPYYATRFSTVELNSPFYRLPSPDTVVRWRRSTPPGFLFAFKASRFLTHMKRLRDPAGPLGRLLRRARRLGDALGPVLFQLPSDFQFDPERLDTFLAALGRQRLVPGLRAVLEVRHASWLTPQATERLERAGVALCLADWKELPVTGPVTADFVYIRRHGWGVAYGGRYPDRVLGADAERIDAWRRQGRDIYIYFNNDADAAAIANARRLRALAGEDRFEQNPERYARQTA